MTPCKQNSLGGSTGSVVLFRPRLEKWGRRSFLKDLKFAISASPVVCKHPYLSYVNKWPSCLDGCGQHVTGDSGSQLRAPASWREENAALLLASVENKHLCDCFGCFFP